MPKQTSTKATTKTQQQSVVEDVPVTINVEIATTTEQKKAKSPRKKAAPGLIESSVEVSAPETTTENSVQEVTVAGETGEVNVDKIADLFAKLQQVTNLVSNIKADLRTWDRDNSRRLRNATKESSKKKNRNGKVRPPSGFVKPAPISDELASFLGKDKGTEMARTAVTRDINQYIRLHNLQDKDNGRKINPDSKLSTLLKIGKDDILTYFNLQRYMSQHFPKAAVDLQNTILHATSQTA